MTPSAISIRNGRIERVGALNTDASAIPESAKETCMERLLELREREQKDGRDRAKESQKSVGSEKVEWTDLQGGYLAPGFLDLHDHGGLVFAAAKDLAASLHASCAHLVQEGVTAFLPTTVTSSQARLEEIFEALVPVLESNASERKPSSHVVHNGNLAVPLGLHLEGPWIHAACAGAQPKAAIRNYDAAQGEAIFSRFGNWIRMVTLAPEVKGAELLLETLAERGILAALGHSQASAKQAEAAIELGARHVTHLFNAMKPLHHRDPGLLGVALSDDRLSCDLICDGVHLDSRVVRLAALVKRERLVLITDRIEVPKMRDPNLAREGEGFGAVHDDGTALRLSDGRLAGSSLSMNRAFRNAQSFGALSLLEAVAACTLRPARVLGIEAERGTFREGARADFVVLDAEGEVLQTWIAGKQVFRRTGKTK